MDTDIYAALRPVLEFLEQHRIVYCIGGSLASSAWSAPRLTNDADLVAEFDASHIQPMIDRLGDDFYVSRAAMEAAIQNHSCFNLIHYGTSLKVDVFIRKDRDFDREAMSRITRQQFGTEADGVKAWIASCEDVILNKIMWYDQGNRISERQWDDIQKVLKVQQHRVDVAYLRKWALALGVADLLEESLTEAGLAP